MKRPEKGLVTSGIEKGGETNFIDSNTRSYHIIPNDTELNIEMK